MKATITRLTPAKDPDLYARIRVTKGANERGSIFAGVYAPGSVVKLWQEEAQQAGERVNNNEVGLLEMRYFRCAMSRYAAVKSPLSVGRAIP